MKLLSVLGIGIKWVKGNLIKVLLIAFAVVLLTLIGYMKANKALRIDNKRQTENLAQITQEGVRQLNLTRKEYDNLNTAWKTKLDSTIKANKIALKSVKSATIIQTQYKDTGSTKIVYKDVIKLPDSSYKLPFESDSLNTCWGVKGNILTLDPNAKIEITEKTANNSISLIVTQKRFLGFLWYKKATKFRGFTDCGESDITDIKFEK